MTTETSSAHELIESALPLFGRHGLEGASTREIARAAGKPMSAITYHFGGKEALYLACAKHIGDTIGEMMGPAVALSEAGAGSPGEARAAMRQLTTAMVGAILRDETAEFARFIVREQQEPTAAFDMIYSGMMGKVLARMVQLMTIVTNGRASDTEVRVHVIALMGQILAFRVARAATLRLTGWPTIGDAERALIDRVIQTHLSAIFDSFEREPQA